MIKRLLKWFRIILGSMFFIGFIPLAPGTLGALITVAVLWFSMDTVSPLFLSSNAATFWLLYLLLLSITIFITNQAKENFGVEDPKQIIIDESVGQLIVFFLIPLSWRVLILGFLLFRFYDIVKPFPVYKFEDLEDGLGITMDDVVAGILANISLFFILWLYHVIKSYL
jgi:phosphatidylglycerophosphatase A